MPRWRLVLQSVWMNLCITHPRATTLSLKKGSYDNLKSNVDCTRTGSLLKLFPIFVHFSFDKFSKVRWWPPNRPLNHRRKPALSLLGVVLAYRCFDLGAIYSEYCEKKRCFELRSVYCAYWSLRFEVVFVRSSYLTNLSDTVPWKTWPVLEYAEIIIANLPGWRWTRIK